MCLNCKNEKPFHKMRLNGIEQFMSINAFIWLRKPSKTECTIIIQTCVKKNLTLQFSHRKFIQSKYWGNLQLNAVNLIIANRFEKRKWARKCVRLKGGDFKPWNANIHEKALEKGEVKELGQMDGKKVDLTCTQTCQKVYTFWIALDFIKWKTEQRVTLTRVNVYLHSYRRLCLKHNVLWHTGEIFLVFFHSWCLYDEQKYHILHKIITKSCFTCNTWLFLLIYVIFFGEILKKWFYWF